MPREPHLEKSTLASQAKDFLGPGGGRPGLDWSGVVWQPQLFLLHPFTESGTLAIAYPTVPLPKFPSSAPPPESLFPSNSSRHPDRVGWPEPTRRSHLQEPVRCSEQIKRLRRGAQQQSHPLIPAACSPRVGPSSRNCLRVRTWESAKTDGGRWRLLLFFFLLPWLHSANDDGCWSEGADTYQERRKLGPT